jgi:hypothetical protein
VKTYRILAPVLVAVVGAGCIAPELIPMDRAAYQAALVEPVWNATPIDPYDFLREFVSNKAAASMKYERKVLRFRGAVTGVWETMGVSSGGWSVGVESEVRPRPSSALLSCGSLSRSEAASLSVGQPLVVVAEMPSGDPVNLGGSGSALFLERCRIEPVTAETAKAVPPSKAGVSPDYRPEIVVTAEELREAFSTDEVAATQKYGSSPLIVKGIVIAVKPNGSILLQSGLPFHAVVLRDYRESVLDMQQVAVRARIEKYSANTVFLWGCRAL